MMLAFPSRHRKQQKDIHALLAETITERKRILNQWDQSFFGSPSKDIHTLLEETIAERRKILARWERIFSPRRSESFSIKEKKAA